jgi:tetratricopeptide (TPR) repeat protein
MLVFGVEVESEFGEMFRKGRTSELIQKLGTSTNAAEEFLLGLSFVSLGRYSEAEAEFLKCETAFSVPVTIQRRLIAVLQHRGLDETIEILSRIGTQANLSSSVLGSLWHVRGLAEGKRRNIKESASALLESLAHYQKVEDHWGVAQVRDTLGTVEAARGHLESAVHCYSMALVDKCRFGDNLGMALTLGNLGRVHLRVGRFSDAISCFEMDRELCRENHDLRGTCRMHNDIGRAWMASGDWQRAEEELLQGISLSAANNFSDIEFYCHKDLALLRIEQREYAQAKQEIELARGCLRSDVAQYLRTILETTEGEFMVAMHDPQAMEVLQKSVTAFHQAMLPDWEIPARIALAKALIHAKQTLAAERCLLAGLRLARANGYARYFPFLNEAMTRLDVSASAEMEEGKGFLSIDKGAASPSHGEEGAIPVGAYIFREELGKGGFGSVYRAYDSQRGIEVALKVISIAKLYDSDLRTALLISSKSELEAASRIRHPGIVRVYAIGHDHAGDLYICQELIQGTSLRDEMNSAEVKTTRYVLDTMRAILFALDALHEAQVIHRDLKPQNILLRGPIEPVLIDFGISQLRPRGWFEAPDYSGTLEYMSPEQSYGKSLDARSDLYSIGVILYEWLAGRRPIRLSEPTWSARASAIQTQAPKPISIYRPDLPPKLCILIHQLLEKKARRRPNHARSVAEQLQGFSEQLENR